MPRPRRACCANGAAPTCRNWFAPTAAVTGITAEARAAYDRELALWRLRTAVGDFHQASPPAARGGVSVSEASNLIQGKHL